MPFLLNFVNLMDIQRVISRLEQGQWYRSMDIPFSSTASQSVAMPKSWDSVRKGERGKGNYLKPPVKLLS